VVAVPVARGYESEFAGWAAAIDGHVVAVYVRTQFRRQGVGSMLLTALTDFAPIRVGYWSDDAQSVADHGFPIEHDPTSYHTLLTFMRRSDDLAHIQTKAPGNEKGHRISP
jgi:GNAT superfamily N-acetyltransferase